MPMSQDFEERLYPHLKVIAAQFGTPFHLYDEIGIRKTCSDMRVAFGAEYGYRNYFAVKALPNPAILKIMLDEGFGFDCSSVPELILARKVGAKPSDIMFTSNNTSEEEFEVALSDGGCILNLDDITLIEKVPHMPEIVSFRYNPGDRRSGNVIIGDPVEAKYGVSHNQLIDAYRLAKKHGATRFGLHTMIVSNERDYRELVKTVRMLLELTALLHDELDIELEFINIGGGLGIPYHPEDKLFNLRALGKEANQLLSQFKNDFSYVPKLFSESGRFVAGPHGVLVTRVINMKHTYREYRGVDANMSSLMRPGIYGAYHHITVLGRDCLNGTEIIDVVGALCENNDKFAVQRELPILDINDLIIIHDTGAHGHAMGFNYNGRLRPQELILRCDCSVERIRRAETVDDLFATLNFKPFQLKL